MKQNIVLISSGPQQLLAQIALMQQLRKWDEVVGAVSYVSGHDRVIEFDRYVCDAFGVEYLGSIADLKDKIVEFGFGSTRRAFGTVFRRDLQPKIKKWLVEKGLWDSLENAQVVMSYRANLMADNLLLNVISPQQVYFIPDGFYLTINKNLSKRIPSYFLGIDNFFKKKSSNYYLPQYLPCKSRPGLKTFSLENYYLYDVYNKFSRIIKDEAKNVKAVRHSSGPINLLVWQNLYPQFLKDKKLLCDLFVKIVTAECKNTTIPLLVKPHPRSDLSHVEELKVMIPSSLRGSVSILEDDTFIACPVEVLVELYDFPRVSGVASTGLLTLKENKNMEVVVYTSPLFPKKIRSEIMRFSSMIGIEPVEL